MFVSMDLTFFLGILITLLFRFLPVLAALPPTTSRISVVGAVFCDTCSSNKFSKHCYFMPGVDVHIQCKFKAYSPKTAEQVSFSVNKTTDKHGVYRLYIPSVDGINCIDGMAIETMCQASLIGSSSSACNVPGLKSTSYGISVKSKQDNLCIYNLNALSFKPDKIDTSLCGHEKLASSLDDSKLWVPFFPPYGLYWPPLPQFPFPPLPPLTYLPFPPIPFLKPPSLPFPFPPLPPYPPLPSLFNPPPPPAFNLKDPRTWIPHIPSFSSPPPPPPPVFNLRDPKTWVPHFPPSSHNNLQNQKP